MIYCVEDDCSIRELILYTLQNTGFEARGFSDGRTYFASLGDLKPELVLLDVMLPDMDGMEILRKMRSSPAYKLVPVIMVTARGSEYDKVIGLESGADDYIAKPFGMMEFISRVRAVLRRSGTNASATVLEAGGIMIHTEKHLVTVSGKEIILTHKEFLDQGCLLRSTRRKREACIRNLYGTGLDTLRCAFNI